jgi:hypothetical protein
VQGQNYLSRLAGLDDQIAAISARIDSAREACRAAEKALSDYIASMNI